MLIEFYLHSIKKKDFSIVEHTIVDSRTKKRVENKHKTNKIVVAKTKNYLKQTHMWPQRNEIHKLLMLFFEQHTEMI